jgi:hypothetical protein
LSVLSNNAIELLYIFKGSSHDQWVKDAITIIAKNSYASGRVSHRSNFSEVFALNSLRNSSDRKDINKACALSQPVNLLYNTCGIGYR